MTMDNARLILASGSPRRRNFLEMLGLPHRVQPADIEEKRGVDEGPADFARRAAREKAAFVARHETLPVLAADTVVALDGDTLGKPTNRQQAATMLRRLSGREHEVHTGVALALEERCECLVDTSRVCFITLDEAVISWYLDTDEPMDKAGAYAVQGVGGILVSSVIGSPQTVVGLPIHRLPSLFSSLGLNLWEMLG
ncbi:MAG: Maf family protein [Thermoanaerobaculales bacterium]|nr:Maf family protein [Thermoanaerobaculales bacterium]